MAHSITHVIFDVDGLLLDSERLYDTINAQIAQEYGRTFTQDVRRKIKGKKEAEVAQSLIEELDLPITVHDFLIKDREQQEILLPTVDLLPGAEKLVRHLHKQGIPIAIATGSSSRSMRLKTTRHKDLFSLFNHFVYSSDDPEVINSKPAPDCFLLASSRFPDQPEPRKCLVFEDACNGLLAAHAAGMHCVWVPDQDQPQEGYREIATLTLESLLQFKPEQLGLPPYNV
ncbi:probable pseudouridine-5'-phosphatase [Ylistrum balloti]|uniref:probable pseudouridine-5'-phosphatase n=1 Tax=Ylistrum balloti TaxID=509963 RepID=UPI002905E690|nr:probable pseudouridine-5'-phosphatase [Ylistrum balloti]